MKRTAVALLMAVMAFFAAEELRVLLQNAISAEVLRGLESGASAVPFTPGHSALLQAAVFAAVYFAAGAAVGWVLRARPEGSAVALAVGLAAPLSTLSFSPPVPFTWSTHAPLWLELVYWANWYAPPIGALGGALIAKHAARRSRIAHAA